MGKMNRGLSSLTDKGCTKNSGEEKENRKLAKEERERPCISLL